MIGDGVDLAGARAEEPVEAEDVERRLETLFRDHSSRLFRLALRMSGGRADAEDSVQEVFVRAAKSADSLPRESERAGAWLVRTLINVERDRKRRLRVRRRARPELAESGARGSATDPVAFFRSSFREAVAALPARRRAILLLSAVDGRTVPEISELLGVSQVTVRWHLMQARRALRPLLGAKDHG